MKPLYVLLCSTALLATAGCATKTPGCSDPESVDLIKQIFDDAAGKLVSKAAILTLGTIKPEQVTAQIKLDVTNIRTSGHDEATGKYQCDAVLVASLPPEAEKPLGNELATAMTFPGGLGNAHVEGGKLTESIKYSVQLTDDKKHVYAEISEGGNDIAESSVALVLRSEMSKPRKSDGAAAGNTPAPNPAPTAGQSAATAAAPGKPAENAADNSDPACPGVDTSTTDGQRDCIAIQYKAADSDLNATYKQLMATLPDAAKATLKEEQRGWVKQKEAKCAAAAKEFEGGTMEQVTRDDCELGMTKDRATYLHNYKK